MSKRAANHVAAFQPQVWRSSHLANQILSSWPHHSLLTITLSPHYRPLLMSTISATFCRAVITKCAKPTFKNWCAMGCCLTVRDKSVIIVPMSPYSGHLWLGRYTPLHFLSQCCQNNWNLTDVRPRPATVVWDRRQERASPPHSYGMGQRLHSDQLYCWMGAL